MQRRLVLLGASNLSRSFPCMVTHARNCFAEPVAIYAAKGFGRSYGLDSGCLGKKFPGIFFSGIWRALEHSKSVPTSAIVTDIGNDLGYEVSVETILQWVSGCIERLTELSAQVVVSSIAIDPIRALSERRFRWYRKLLFPNCRLGKDEIIARAEALNDALQRLAEAKEIPVFTASNDWYGFDPIHPRRRFLCDWCRGMWQRLPEPQLDSELPWPTLWDSIYLQLLQAETWTRFGVDRTTIQPDGQLNDGSSIFLY